MASGLTNCSMVGPTHGLIIVASSAYQQIGRSIAEFLLLLLVDVISFHGGFYYHATVYPVNYFLAFCVII